MIDLTTYALLRKQINEAATGVKDVRADGENLVFVLADGREISVAVLSSLTCTHDGNGNVVLTTGGPNGISET